MPAPFSTRALKLGLAALATALAAACGGGGNEQPDPAPASASATPISRLIVAGDSLADVGTFGFKATVQSSTTAAGYPVYPELVARELGVGALCNYFTSSTEGASFAATSGNCTNYAVAGAMVVNPATRGGNDRPFSLQHQLETALSAAGNRWNASDLVVVDAGANDVAALSDAYLDARYGGNSEEAIYAAFLAQQLSTSEIDDASSVSGANAGAAYMRELAHTYWGFIKGNTIDRGATHVAVLNIPDINHTPRFRSIATEIEANHGAADAAQFRADLRNWIVVFNTELATLVNAEPRAVLVPYFQEFDQQIASPAANGLTNVTQASCPASSEFPQCTDAALDAAPPAGQAAGWWRTYYFSDEFHPTPRGHELLAGIVNRAIARAGWR